MGSFSTGTKPAVGPAMSARFIRHYKDVVGEQEIDMHKVEAYAKRIGWKMLTPPSDVEPGFFKMTHHQHLISRDTSIATPWVHCHEN